MRFKFSWQSYRTPFSTPELIAHCSGLVRESPVGDDFHPTEPSLTETIASFNDTCLIYKPGMKTKYSNAAVADAARCSRNNWVSHTPHKFARRSSIL